MKKILFLLAHPHLERSRCNKAIADEVLKLPEVTYRPLYDLYPSFHVDLEKEQKLLEAHDLIFIQHPLYWYSMPPLLKHWLDEVWESGWAYGPNGNKLHGKDFLLSVTAGAPKDAYHTEGYNRYDLETLLSPWNQTAHLCGLKWLSPFYLHRSSSIPAPEIQVHAEKVARSLAHYQKTGEVYQCFTV